MNMNDDSLECVDEIRNYSYFIEINIFCERKIFICSISLTEPQRFSEAFSGLHIALKFLSGAKN